MLFFILYLVVHLECLLPYYIQGRKYRTKLLLSYTYLGICVIVIMLYNSYVISPLCHNFDVNLNNNCNNKCLSEKK